MGADYRINEYGEIIRDDNTPHYTSELSVYEDAMLRGERLKIDIRRKLAKETRNKNVLWKCIKDNSITVVIAAKSNPALTSEMRAEIEGIAKKMDFLKPKKSKSNNKGCLWFIIIACLIGMLATYFSNEISF